MIIKLIKIRIIMIIINNSYNNNNTTNNNNSNNNNNTLIHLLVDYSDEKKTQLRYISLILLMVQTNIFIII
jgi:hypothetical protein